MQVNIKKTNTYEKISRKTQPWRPYTLLCARTTGRGSATDNAHDADASRGVHTSCIPLYCETRSRPRGFDTGNEAPDPIALTPTGVDVRGAPQLSRGHTKRPNHNGCGRNGTRVSAHLISLSDHGVVELGRLLLVEVYHLAHCLALLQFLRIESNRMDGRRWRGTQSVSRPKQNKKKQTTGREGRRCSAVDFAAPQEGVACC